MNIKVTIDLKKFEFALKKQPKLTRDSLRAAGREAAELILSTEGLRRYPPEGEGNRPPTPYYIRGRGTQYGNKKRKNTRQSERLGTKFYVKSTSFRTTIGNNASYAPYVVGINQSSLFNKIGWRILFEVSKEKIKEINKIYEKWIIFAFNRAGLPERNHPNWR